MRALPTPMPSLSTAAPLATATTTPTAVKSVWIPGPDLVEQRVQFAHDHGLQEHHHLGNWAGPASDNANSLLRRAYEKNQSFLPVPVPGDYDGSGGVGPEDYDLWKSTYGSTSGDMRADGNEDGVVDAADYTFWRDRVSSSAGQWFGGQQLRAGTVDRAAN